LMDSRVHHDVFSEAGIFGRTVALRFAWRC